jgi:FkbM family methyltransferase
MELRPIQWLGHAFRRLGNEILWRTGISGTWIDVGAHYGEMTLRAAHLNPALKVYAFEPNLSAVAKLAGRTPNFVVIPMAVAERDGWAEFHVNAFEQSSSLLPLHPKGVKSWIGGEVLVEESIVSVPTVRLDTFMNLMGIRKVDYLKIDAQGMDLAVVKSAGARLSDIAKIVLEVSLTAIPTYVGAPSKEEVTAFLEGAGFLLVAAEKQTHGQEENLTFVRVDRSNTPDSLGEHLQRSSSCDHEGRTS